MRRLAAFTALVLALEAATVLAGPGRDVTPFVLVLIPPVAALLVAAAGGGGAAVKSLFGRMGRWRVGWPWYLAALGIPVIEKLVVDAAGILSGAATPDLLVGALTVSALVVPLVVLAPALLEEFGWRGFGVQTAVDGGRSPVWAAAVVGVVRAGHSQRDSAGGIHRRDRRDVGAGGAGRRWKTGRTDQAPGTPVSPIDGAAAGGPHPRPHRVRR
jgi:hypothetical protein